MTSFSNVSSVFLAAVLACVFAGVCAYEDYGDYLIPDTNGYYPLDKRSYNSYCRRCMSSDYDWVSCYKCWDRPGRSAPYYGGKKKRGFSTRPGHIVPYYGKRADESYDIFPEQDLQEEKRSSLFKCSCCMRTEDPRCCSECSRFFDKRDDKRGYVISFADYGDEEEGCGCCQRGYFTLSCCLRCLQSKK